jgi:hypothetical protein
MITAGSTPPPTSHPFLTSRKHLSDSTNSSRRLRRARAFGLVCHRESVRRRGPLLPIARQACTDPSSLLAPSNLHICITLAGAAFLVQNGKYAVDLIDAETNRTLGLWAVPDLTAFNATGLLREVAQCLPESCIVSALGECAEEERSLGSIEPRVENLEAISSVLGHYCESMQVAINSDIAGPGVCSLSSFPQ